MRAEWWGTPLTLQSCARPIPPSPTQLLFNVINRGNKGGLSLFNADVPQNPGDNNALKVAGDGWLQRQGYTLVWFGWQADVLPGNGRMTLSVPVAVERTGRHSPASSAPN